MGRIETFTGFGREQVARISTYLALTMLYALLLSTKAHALHADEVTLQERLPVAIKVTPLEAKSRIRHWQDFIQHTRHKSVADKLTAVNDYFNALRFIQDENLWRKPDYWATPLQVLAAGAGDCEDFAIAKYFTLRTLGVTDEHLRITYTWNRTTSSGRREPHMVLIYLATANAEPLVLDILTADIQTLARRKGLEPVYGLNSGGLWLVGTNAKPIPAGNPAQLSQWRLLSREMERDTTMLFRKY